MRKCAVCGKECETFVPIDRKYLELPKKYGRTKEVKSEFFNSEEYSCPYCYASDRERMIVMFVKKLQTKLTNGIRFLEIAPSGALQRYLQKIVEGKSSLYTADLYMEDVDFQVDIQDMAIIPDGSFDFIVCSHVLEHVKSDTQAIREIYRILDEKGLALMLIPLDLNQTCTDEAWGLSEEENFRRFGQGDHVRSYNKEDFIKRLEKQGFGVHQIGKDFFEEKEFEENALTETATLYLVYKNRRLYSERVTIIEEFARIHKNSDYKRGFHKVDTTCNYWIDSCTIGDNTLNIWGWFYLKDLNSRYTKYKLLLECEKDEYIFDCGCLRKREDIQEQFGNEENNYVYSGIDIQQELNKIYSEICRVFVLIENEERKYKLEISKI